MHRRRRSPSPRSRRDRRSRSRSPSYRRRRFRYDSPPKEEAIIANLHGLTDEAATYRQMKELTAIADAGTAAARAEQQRQAKELYIGNIPPGIAVFALIDRLNDVLVEMGATTMPGKPIVSGWLGGQGQFAFLQLRTTEECNNALSLNGYTFDGFQLKVGRPKGAMGTLTYGGSTSSLVHGPATQFSLDELSGLGVVVQPALDESTKVETLVLVGAPDGAETEVLVRILETESNGQVEKFEEFVSTQLGRKSIIFEFKDVKFQRHIASRYLAFDRDFPLAIVRPDEAVAAGFINVRDEQFTSWDRSPAVSKILWMCNFASISPNEVAEFAYEVRQTCCSFGQVVSFKILTVNRDNVAVPIIGPEKDVNIVVVEFDSVQAACKCKKYLKGASIYFMPENQYEAAMFESFSPNTEPSPPITPSDESLVTIDPPLIRNGKIISVQKSIIEANKMRRHHKPAPEELEIID